MDVVRLIDYVVYVAVVLVVDDLVVVLLVGMCSPVDDMGDVPLHGQSMLMHLGMDMDHLATVSIPMVFQFFGTPRIWKFRIFSIFNIKIKLSDKNIGMNMNTEFGSNSPANFAEMIALQCFWFWSTELLIFIDNSQPE